MITGNGSAELGLLYEITSSSNGVGEASLGLDFSASGYIPIFGDGSAGLGLSYETGGIFGDGSAALGMDCQAEGLVGIIGEGSADLRLSFQAVGLVGIVGEGAIELGLDVDPVGFITIVGDGSAELGLEAWALGFIQAVLENAGYLAGVVNTKTRGPALYTNFPINSFIPLNGKLYGCTDQGIVRLSGKKDNGADIDTRIRSGISNYDESCLKRYPKFKITLRCEGLMELAVKIDERKEVVYEVAAREGQQGIHTKTVPLAKGARGHSVQWELRNVQGADFDLQESEMHPLFLDRS